MDLSKLKEPFKESDIEWRIGRDGEKNGKIWCMVLAYVTNRAIMDRLDEVCGPENWRNEYRDIPNNGVECTIFIKYDNEWIGKVDAAQNTAIETVKGGRSDAMKRAGVQWGIGRYLYNLEAGFGNVVPKGRFTGSVGKNPSKTSYKWNPPALPAWALPSAKEEDDSGLAYKLDTLLSEKDLTDNEKKQVVTFYCKFKKIQIVELHELTADHVRNFTKNIDAVISAFIDAIDN